METPNTPNQPWEQLADETDTAYHRFSVYLHLGPDRSFEKVRQEVGKSTGYIRQIEKWSSKYNWVKRASDFDKHLIRKSLKNKEKVLEEAEGRLLQMVDSALDDLVEVLKMPMGEVNPEGYRSLVREKLKAVDMVLNRVGLVEQKEPVEPEKPTEVNNYIHNVYEKIENYNATKSIEDEQ